MNEEIKNILAEKQEAPTDPAKIPGVIAPPDPAKFPGIIVPPDPASETPGVVALPDPASETPGVVALPGVGDPASSRCPTRVTISRIVTCRKSLKKRAVRGSTKTRRLASARVVRGGPRLERIS